MSVDLLFTDPEVVKIALENWEALGNALGQIDWSAFADTAVNFGRQVLDLPRQIIDSIQNWVSSIDIDRIKASLAQFMNNAVNHAAEESLKEGLALANEIRKLEKDNGQKLRSQILTQINIASFFKQQIRTILQALSKTLRSNPKVAIVNFFESVSNLMRTAGNEMRKLDFRPILKFYRKGATPAEMVYREIYAGQFAAFFVTQANVTTNFNKIIEQINLIIKTRKLEVTNFNEVVQNMLQSGFILTAYFETMKEELRITRAKWFFVLVAGAVIIFLIGSIYYFTATN